MQTPTLQILLFRLSELENELSTNLVKLNRHFEQTDDQAIVLQSAVHNIVDKKKEKEHRKKSWKMEVKEIIQTPIQYDKCLE